MKHTAITSIAITILAAVGALGCEDKAAAGDAPPSAPSTAAPDEATPSKAEAPRDEAEGAGDEVEATSDEPTEDESASNETAKNDDPSPAARGAAKPATAPTPKDEPAAKAAATQPPSKVPEPASPKEAGYTGDKPCKRTTFKTAQVRYACTHGGQPEAKALMKRVVKAAKAAGETMKCKSCHESLKTYENKPNAVADLRKWLGKI